MSYATIHIDMHLPFPIEQVWRAWTDPAVILHWFGSDPGGRGVSAEMDVRPGGPYAITFQNGDGTEFTCFGTYEVVDGYESLSFTWHWANEPGQASRVIIGLSADAGSTDMSFTHAGVWSESSHDYEEGWRRTFGKLEKALAAPSA
ncbi:MAG TPA: SRPBCC domain-containing protein [Dinghuibacter sp.]|jgi:uncharacterized protein YndB with AHSA1/START domain|uniref:SRPBCC family protein n=1 Tax=Dinghuibacter sp. TaxID=2024697 RepID=UPI002B7F2D42|nr:SRPBCC domain-containing protein [Dinghuibacter sp.]HTJ12201.1 SRPBCC domain-containing protein [Dinghuibacter sp.]